MVEIRNIDANGMTFRCREAGTAGEPVILLHGFPETSHMWLPLMERLAAEGYRCLAPDQRGYSPGARPEGADHYRYIDTASDVRTGRRVPPNASISSELLGRGCGWAVVALHSNGCSAGRCRCRTPMPSARRSELTSRQWYVTFFQRRGRGAVHRQRLRRAQASGRPALRQVAVPVVDAAWRADAA
jgi:pimeloyl-ACP methyl ester carboxylesterase